MDTRKQLLFVNGEDKSDSIASFSLTDGKCAIIYNSSPKVYVYNSSNVQLLNLQTNIDTKKVIVSINDSVITNIDQLLDFGSYYKVVHSGKKNIYPKSSLKLDKNCIADGCGKNLFDYLRVFTYR